MSYTVGVPIAFFPLPALALSLAACPPTSCLLSYVRIHYSGQPKTDKPLEDLSFGLGSQSTSFLSSLSLFSAVTLCTLLSGKKHSFIVCTFPPPPTPPRPPNPWWKCPFIVFLPGVANSQICRWCACICWCFTQNRRRREDRLVWGREGFPTVNPVTVCGTTRSRIRQNNRWTDQYPYHHWATDQVCVVLSPPNMQYL